ncbi:hypothetical protein [Sinorhizobium fredii]|uniref:Uncharacterized protein n=1 Tax=Rhizobium fredii TaxID=380 RepID=A0A2L0HCM9_RHIFR|nr:hypothetical protein NXT3_PB00264 [Sinorhizobium fredii]
MKYIGDHADLIAGVVFLPEASPLERRNPHPGCGVALRRTIFPLLSTLWIWKTCFAISRPIVAISMGGFLSGSSTCLFWHV